MDSHFVTKKIVYKTKVNGNGKRLVKPSKWEWENYLSKLT